MYYGYSVFNHVSLNYDYTCLEKGKLDVNSRMFSLKDMITEITQYLKP